MANSNVFHTSNPTSDYTFSWTIENFQFTSKKLRGTSFSPITGFGERFCFEIEANRGKFCVRLVCLDIKNLQMYVSANMTLSNTRKVLFKKSCPVMWIQPTTLLIDHFPGHPTSEAFKFLLGLRDSTLKLEGTLTFSGYDLSTSVSVNHLSIQQPEENWACRELTKDLKAMYESGRGSDVTFTIGDEKLSAHKAILAARSPVFAKMFEANMRENITNNVNIEDIDSNTFKDFLLFLYTGVAGDLKCESAVSLYPVSKKYQVESLQKFCVFSLGCNLTVDNACEALLLADLYEDDDLKGIVKIFFQKNFSDLAGTTKWAELIINRPELVKEVTDFIKPVPNN